MTAVREEVLHPSEPVVVAGGRRRAYSEGRREQQSRSNEAIALLDMLHGVEDGTRAFQNSSHPSLSLYLTSKTPLVR